MASEQHNSDDEIYRAVFGEQTGISQSCRERITRVRDNDPDLKQFYLETDVADHFSDLAWELLGGYIASNDHLNAINLSRLRLRLTEAKMSLLFKNWITRSEGLEELNLSFNNFGIDGIRSMVPFLTIAQNLSKLNISENYNVNRECFRLLVGALHSGGSIERLYLSGCDIEDISALKDYSLPHLRILDLDYNNIQSLQTSLENYTNLERLDLDGNKIGREGCRSIAKLLQKEGSCLSFLHLDSTDMDDDAAEIIANSLKRNTSLESLYLGGDSNFTGKGTAFLKLLNDVSSVDSTYSSNYTLTNLILDGITEEMMKHIESAIGINRSNDGNSHAAGRAKVIETQLNSQKRKELCCLQGVDYSYESIFSDIEPLLLPEVLSLVGGMHGHDELFRMMIATEPDLASIVNRDAVVQQMIAENTVRMSELVSENLKLNEELATMESVQAKQKMQAIAVLLGEVHELNKALASVEFTETDEPMDYSADSRALSSFDCSTVSERLLLGLLCESSLRNSY